MAREDLALERLRDALSALAADDASALVQEARAQARERVLALLAEALSDSMLSAVEEELDGRAIAGARSSAPAPETAGSPELAPAELAPASELAAPAPESAPLPRDLSGVADYVYGVISATDAEHPGLPDATADGEALRIVLDGNLAAVVSEVPLSDFEETRLREHLSDMAWVESKARHHEGVLESIAAMVTVIPMRMCTVYGSETGIRQLLRREAASLRDALRYLAGKREWGVKVFGHETEPEPVDGARHIDRGGSGAEYMQQRLRERDARAQAAEEIEDAAARIHEQLCTVAADALILPPQRPQVSGRQETMVLNGVYLVGIEAQERFHAQVRALGQEFDRLGLELATTGPWPAYNFVPGAIGAAW